MPSAAIVDIAEVAHEAERFVAAYHLAIARALRACGSSITPTQALILLRLPPKPVRVGSILGGAYLGTNASYNLKRLEKAGLLSGRRLPEDRRAREIELTAAGAELCRKVTAGVASAIPDVMDEVVENLSVGLKHMQARIRVAA